MLRAPAWREAPAPSAALAAPIPLRPLSRRATGRPHPQDTLALVAGAGAAFETMQLQLLNVLQQARSSLEEAEQEKAREFNAALTLNVLATQALIAGFDGMLRKSSDARVVAVTSSVATPRAYWGAYGASKAALETLVGAYGEEMKNISAIRTHIVDPGATRTAMRARAFPGEDPATLKGPEVVADAIVGLVTADTPTGHKARVEG